jgi:hypothetical protein
MRSGLSDSGRTHAGIRVCVGEDVDGTRRLGEESGLDLFNRDEMGKSRSLDGRPVGPCA